MRILIITEEDEFYLPLSIDYLLKTFGSQVTKVVCARNPLLPGKIQTVKKFYRVFGLAPIISQAFRVLKAKILNILGPFNYTGRYYSVKKVCNKYHIPYLHCENINAPDFLNQVRNLNIDLITSVSPTQIFKKELINLPKHGCINIHTAKLPKYRGLYPTYWAMVCEEKEAGISIHYIEEGIDTGKIILQDQVTIPPETTLHHMLTETKLKGAMLLAEAIKLIDSASAEAFYPQGQGEYYSFPTSQSYQQFKKLGYKLW